MDKVLAIKVAFFLCISMTREENIMGQIVCRCNCSGFIALWTDFKRFLSQQEIICAKHSWWSSQFVDSQPELRNWHYMLLEICLWGLPHYKARELGPLKLPENKSAFFFFLVNLIKKLYFLLWTVDKEKESFSMGGWLLSSKALVNDGSASYRFPLYLRFFRLRKGQRNFPPYTVKHLKASWLSL